MLLHKIDFISPSISLFFDGKRTHTSKISGLIVIIMVLGCLSYTFILLNEVFNHSNVISLIYKKFEFEAGFYQMNTTQLFHFFQIFSSEEGGYFDKYDSKFIRIYLTYVRNNIDQSQLNKYDHWVFEECREGIENNDLSQELFENIFNFTNAACIRYYFNSKNKKYYSLEEKEFIWPHLEHGISRRDNIFLTSLIEKCSNDSILTKILGNCAPEESINEYVQKYFGFYMYFLDISIDPTNYENPFQTYFQIISSGMGNSKTFVENYIHFAPVRMRTKVGEIFGNYHEENTFFFDFNRKGTADSYNRVLLKTYYLMQNNFNIYERRYKGIFDILSSIGGAIQLLFFGCSLINSIYNEYIVIMDTNHFFCQIAKESNIESSKKIKTKIFNPFESLRINFETNIMNNNSVKKEVFSLNYNVPNPVISKKFGNKSEFNAKKSLQNKSIFSKFKDNIIKKNNYFPKTLSGACQTNEIIKYINSSNHSNESLDFSNKPINNMNTEKRLDSIDILKEKNMCSTQINELISNSNKTPQNFLNINSKRNNKSNIDNPPKKVKSVQFNENVKDKKKRPENNKIINQKQSNILDDNDDRIFKIQKLNKDMIKKSDYFQKQFTFFVYIFKICFKIKKKEESQNLYSLISFRRKTVSENFIFHQHIINLILGTKCGINPNEIKKLI